MLGIVIFLESTSYLFGSYHRSKLKSEPSAACLLGILSWWWVAALSLRFVDALTGFIVPDLSRRLRCSRRRRLPSSACLA